MNGDLIRWAVENGFKNIAVRPEKLLVPTETTLERKRIITAAVNSMREGRSAVIHTAIGVDDFRMDLMKKQAGELSLTYEETNTNLGNALGEIA